MKIRTGFVSNSSSASFAVPRAVLTEEQLAAIYDPVAWLKAHGFELSSDSFWIDVPDDPVVEDAYSKEFGNLLWPWHIEDDGVTIKGSVSMTNFDMLSFLKEIGVPVDKMERWDSNDGSW